jgi:hypothetical protein
LKPELGFFYIFKIEKVELTEMHGGNLMQFHAKAQRRKVIESD